ncbi:hypothetical protein C8R44DRAFT_295434 [Mycena epipterygia]|nr:hypothetical protein C8R44DRAFT_295434 [Mycena epipterygia]
MFRPALRRVNRVGIVFSSPRWMSTPAWARPMSSLEPESIPTTPVVAKADPTKEMPQPLPTPPEPSTAPLVESDFSQYLDPLYRRGWVLTARQLPPNRGEETPIRGYLFKRVFHFPSTKELLAFSENTRDTQSCGLHAFCKLPQCRVSLPSPTLTRGLIHRAFEAEAAYQQVVGSEYDVKPPKRTSHWIMTSQHAQKILGSIQPPILSNLETAPITPVALPPTPPTADLPPPSITEADLATYLHPLIANGWSIGDIRQAWYPTGTSYYATSHKPALTRVYFFRDYTSARHFLHTVIAAIPNPEHLSLEGAILPWDTVTPRVEVFSISRLAAGWPKYGISHNTLRFALEVEKEFADSWAGGAESIAVSPRVVPNTMEELWKIPSPPSRDINSGGKKKKN